MEPKVADDLRPLLVPIDSLTPMEDGYRRGDVPVIARSLTRFGQRTPLVANEAGEILKGNHTWKAAKSLEWDAVAVVRVRDDRPVGLAYAVADNRASSRGTEDRDALVSLLAEIEERDAGLMPFTGYSTEDLAILAADPVPLDVSTAPLEPDDEDADLPDALPMGRELGQTMPQNILVLGHTKLVLSLKEVDDFRAALEAWVADTGTDFGFIANLLAARKA